MRKALKHFRNNANRMHYDEYIKKRMIPLRTLENPGSARKILQLQATASATDCQLRCVSIAEKCRCPSTIETCLPFGNTECPCKGLQEKTSPGRRRAQTNTAAASPAYHATQSHAGHGSTSMRQNGTDATARDADAMQPVTSAARLFAWEASAGEKKLAATPAAHAATATAAAGTTAAFATSPPRETIPNIRAEIGAPAAHATAGAAKNASSAPTPPRPARHLANMTSESVTENEYMAPAPESESGRKTPIATKAIERATTAFGRRQNIGAAKYSVAASAARTAEGGEPTIKTYKKRTGATNKTANLAGTKKKASLTPHASAMT